MARIAYFACNVFWLEATETLTQNYYADSSCWSKHIWNSVQGNILEICK